MIMHKPEREKILVLCLDRDNDISVKCGVKTPIIGKENIRDAALKLILKDPEESDANALFESIRLHDQIVKESKALCEVAAIGGSEFGGLRADRELSRQLDIVLKAFPAQRVAIVSDGYADEATIPIIQSRIPIMTIRRVVVRHSERIEESWVILSRYVKRLLEDPRYSRILIGVPGLFIVMISVLWFLQLLQYAGLIILSGIGIALFVKGFMIDKMVMEAVGRLKRSFSTTYGQLRAYTSIAGVLITVIAIHRGLSHVFETYGFAELVFVFPLAIAGFVREAIGLIVLGAVIYMTGSGIYYYLTRSLKFLRNLIGITLSLLTYPIAIEISYILRDPAHPPLPLGYWVAIMITVTFALIVLIRRLSREYFR